MSTVQVSFDSAQFTRDYAQVIAKTWDDDEFKKALLENPRGVLKESGIDLGSKVKLSIVPDSTEYEWDTATRTITLPLPKKPAGMAVTAEAVGDVSPCCSCCCCCC